MNVAILGASKKPERYSYRALKMLQEHKHNPIPVSPKMAEIDGIQVCPTLEDINEDIHTLTMYVNAGVSSQLDQEILALKPKRVIFNPGSENPELAEKLKKAGVTVKNACTLVLLQTNSF